MLITHGDEESRSESFVESLGLVKRDIGCNFEDGL